MAKTKATPETKTKATKTTKAPAPASPVVEAPAPSGLLVGAIDAKAKAKASAKAKATKAPEPAPVASPVPAPAPETPAPAPVAQEETSFPMPAESAIVAERLTKGSGKSLLIAVFVTAATLARRIEADAPEADIEAALASLMSSIRSAVHAGRK